MDSIRDLVEFEPKTAVVTDCKKQSGHSILCAYWINLHPYMFVKNSHETVRTCLNRTRTLTKAEEEKGGKCRNGRFLPR